MRHALPLLAALLLLASCEPVEPQAKGLPATDAVPTTEAPAEADKDLPPLQIETWLHSEPLTLEALKGKVVVLDFWSIYCPPCIKLMPHLNGLYAKHKDEGLAVIGITENRKDEVGPFLEKTPVSYPIAIDRLKGGEAQTQAAYGIVAIPTAFLIGRDGRLAWKGQGDKLTDAMILAELAKR